MLFVWIFLVLGASFLVVLVDFVLRNPMFAETFVIKIGVPFTKIEYIQEDVAFIYIIAGSLLLGALVIAISTWVLDAKRKLKVRGLRKELKSLQKAVQEAKDSLPQQEEQGDAESAGITEAEEQVESQGGSLSPEDITKSFENAVEGGHFLENPSEEAPVEEETPEEPAAEEGKNSVREEIRLPQDTAIEAEVVRSDEQAVEDESPSQENAEEEKESKQA